LQTEQQSTRQLTLLQPDLASKLKDLLLKLGMARGVDTPADRYAFLLAMLSEAGYTQEQLDTAAHWILRGNWQYKGTKPILELADFYPETKQLEGLQLGAVLLTSEERQRKLKNAYRMGREYEQAQQIDKDRDTQDYVDLVSFAKEYTSKLAELRSELESSKKFTQQILAQNERLTKRLAQVGSHE